MTTLPEQITDLLSSSNLTTNLQDQVSMVTDAAALLANLISNPRNEIGDLIAGLGSTSVSSIQIPDALTQNFSQLANIIPDDLSGVTGGLDDILGDVGEFANEDTLSSISSYVGCLQAIADLLTIDLSLFDFGAQKSSSSSSTASSADSSSSSADADSSLGAGGGESGGAPRDSSSGTNSSSGAAEETARTKNLETLRGMRGVLDTFPDPFNAENVVKFLSAKLKGVPRHFVNMRHVPIYDDLDQLLETMIQFADMDSAALQTHIQSTLTALKTALERDGQAPLNRLTTSFNDLTTKINTTALDAEMGQLTVALQNIADAVEAEDISGIDTYVDTINTTLDSLLPRLNQILNEAFGGAALQSITQLGRLPRDLDLGMRRLQRMLEPSLSLDFFTVIDSMLNQSIKQSHLNEFTQAIADFFDRITGALETLNSTTLQTALGTVSNALDSTLDGFDDAMLQLAARVSALFDEVDAALSQIDTQALREQIEGAIEEMQNSLEETVNDLFEPVQSAVSNAVATIDTTVASFNPEEIANVLRNVITETTNVLTSTEVTNALNSIRGTIERVTQQVQALSFSPVVDEVIDGIDQITETLQSIEPSQLNAVTKGAIKFAVKEVLPDDLKEPRNYLIITELDRIVDEGPIPLVEQIKAPVEQLTNQVKSLSPEKLIGDSLSKPFNDFIAELEKFTPSSLLAPVQNALDNVKDNVRDQIDLARLLKPLEDLHNNLVSQMDRFGPEQLVDPVERQITSLTDSLLEVLPEEVIFEVLNKIISGIEFITAIVTEVKLIMQKIQSMVATLANPQEQLHSWLQPVLNLVDAMPDIASLQDLFDEVSNAVDKLTASELQTKLHDSTDPLLNALSDLQPQDLLTQLTSAYQDIDRTAVNKLLDSPQKSSLLSTLNRFNPLSPPMSRVFSNLQQWHDDLTEAMTAYETAMLSWDARFFVQGNPFTDLQISDVTTQTIKDLLRKGIEDQAIAPVAKVLSSIGTSIATFNGPIGELENFIDSIEDMLEQITKGPGSLGEIRDTLNQLIERVQNINLQFLEDELNDVFDAVKQKFNDVSPTVFREALQAAIDETLDLIDISLLLPQEDINQIDQTYQALLNKLKGFDPSKLVIDAVKPEFDKKVLPLIDTFDLSKPLDTLIERMDNLTEELGSELSRTDQSYQTMLQAVPV